MNSTIAYLEAFGKKSFDKDFSSLGTRIPETAVTKDTHRRLWVAVGIREKGVPHFHVFRTEADLMKWKHGAAIMFLNNCYYTHTNCREILTDEEIEAVVVLLKKMNIDEGKTNWRFLIEAWNTNNDHNPIDIKTRMPLYKNVRRNTK